MWTREQIDLKLREINASVPQELRGKLFRIKKVTPTSEFLIKKLLKKEDVSEEKKEGFRLLLKSGEFSKTENVIDEKVAKKIDKFVEKEIQRAIYNKELPNKEELEKLPFIQELREKYDRSNPKISSAE